MSDHRTAVERVRTDIDPANTWVVSDSHFGHDNIVGFCHRPEDHEQVMIAEWRRAVPDDATVVHLGDLCYKGNAFFKHIVAKELTGKRKLLIKGNHDRGAWNFYRNSGFRPTMPFSIRYEGRPTSELCWNCQGQGATMFSYCDLCDENGQVHDHERWLVSFSHYPWNDKDDGRPMEDFDLRLHGHIHNNGYSRDEYVPFLRNHINLSLEQTKYTPVNLKLLLDAVILGEYPETTQEQLNDAARRKKEAQNGSRS